MKFKISRLELNKLYKEAENSGEVFIELEPVMSTVTEAMHQQIISREAWSQGYHYGYKVGYHEARKPVDAMQGPYLMRSFVSSPCCCEPCCCEHNCRKHKYC